MFANIEINVLGLAILLIVFLNISAKTNKILFDQKLFIGLIFFNATGIILDIVQLSLDGRPGILSRQIQYIAVTVFFMVNPMPCMFYTLYTDFQIFRNSNRTKKLILPLIFPILLNSIVAILSPLKHYIFYLDSNNVYHRGSLITLVALICYFYIAVGIIHLSINRNKVRKKDYLSLMFFAVPPMIGGFIQFLFYGITLTWVCVAISILIVYINMQNSNIFTDYLTGLNNRRQLDIYLMESVNKSMKDYFLAGIMVDVNKFKEINDLYGHDMGDQALRDTAEILKKSFGKDDFIARYGGDEFVVIYKIKNYNDMKLAISRIRNQTDIFNNQNITPYKLSLSAGSDIFDYWQGTTVERFLKQIDTLMYDDKKRQKI